MPDLNRAVSAYENIQPTPTFFKPKSSSPTTPELAVCYNEMLL